MAGEQQASGANGRAPGGRGAGKRKRGAAKRAIDRAPAFQGWRTSDAEEIERRRWRGTTDLLAIEALEPGQRFHGTYRVRSASGGGYDVEIELPGRSLTNYFVAMTEEQRLRYEEYRAQAAKLVKLAQRRPLTKEEFDRLQLLMACMRMVCDTPYILDPDCRECPKLEELERLLPELLAEPRRKVIVFSEWERMLQLVRELAREMGIEFAWHTGSVPQVRRRAEIARFKQDPDCRLFLSTDSGSVGLNLQAASAVVNLDLPWNPAKLEQRIARAWRKNQRRMVEVINLVAEESIEHTMLHLLAQKQALADGVLDGAADLKALRMPSGRRAFIDRMAEVLGPTDAAPPPVAVAKSPHEALADDLAARLGERLLLAEVRRGEDGRARLLVVLDADAAEVDPERDRIREALADEGTTIEVLDHPTYAALDRLAASGLLRMTGGERRELVRSPRLEAPAAERAAERAQAGAGILAGAERKLRMAQHLLEGGFAEEALPVLSACLDLAARARTVMTGAAPPEGPAAPGPAEDGDGSAPAPERLAEAAGAVARMLAEVRGSLGAVASAA